MKFKILLTIFLFLFLSCINDRSSHDQSPPNIILIMADDMGYECVGSNGGLSYQTPYLDQMAAGGLRFEHCYSQPLCTPSRVQIMTGRYNHRNYSEFAYLDPQEITFGHLLSQAGYKTAIAGKWQLDGDRDAPFDFGFSEYCLWKLDLKSKKDGENPNFRYHNPHLIQNGQVLDVPEESYGPDLCVGFITEFIEKNKDGPFFVYYPMILPHYPFVPTPDHRDWPSKAAGIKGIGKAKYFGDMVRYTDKLVGRINQRLADLKIQNNTLLIFTTDNGTHKRVVSKTKKGNVKGGKGQTTNAGTHVPLIMQWPDRIPAGKTSQALVDFSDFLPTFTAMAGASLPNDRVIDGHDLLPHLTEGQDASRDWIFCHYDPNLKTKTYEKARYFRNHEYKLYADGRFYHVAQDVKEAHDLSQTELSGIAKETRDKLELLFGQID